VKGILQSDCSSASSLPAAKVVLIVDDELPVLMTLCKILAHAGFAVLAAASPEEALRIAAERSGPIDLMLCDVAMPGMSGPQMALQFAILQPETRLMFMAGLPDGPEITAIVQQGTPFLPKPFRPDELVASIREVLAGPSPAPLERV
jgi:two-component system cell cycle sensor histidine kinase/response regulator CckA